VIERDGIDRALDSAVARVRSAEDRFLDQPAGTPEAVDLAHEVEQRAEDVEELASDARKLSVDSPG